MASMSYAKYFLLSLAGGVGVIYHAFATRQHFYPATVYLSTSKLAVAVVGNLVFASALLGQSLIIKVFLGGLRDIELEMVRERLSSAIMESLLALTVFRDEFGAFFVAMFASLLFLKVLHWLVEDRVDYIEVSPSVSALQHLRITSFLALLLAVDSLFVDYTIQGSIKSGGQSVMVLFAFEYVILATDVFRHGLKYLMSMADLMLMDGSWESKGTYVFYLELITDVLHLFVYVVFFVVVFTNYGLPLHLVRDLYTTFRNFRNRLADFLRFRQVTARLDQLPDATLEDLARSDGVCIICREEMSPTGSNKRLHCNHVFHLQCLRSWLERQQNCPTCRAPVFPVQPPAVRRVNAGAVLADLPGQAPQRGNARAGAGAQPAQEQHPLPAAAAAAAPPERAPSGVEGAQRTAALQQQQHEQTRSRGGAGRPTYSVQGSAQQREESLQQRLQLLFQLAPSAAAAAAARAGGGGGAGNRGHTHAGGAAQPPGPGPGPQQPPPFQTPMLGPNPWQPHMSPWGPYYPGMGAYPPMMVPPMPGLPPMAMPAGPPASEAYAPGALPDHFLMPPPMAPSPFFMPPMMPTLLPPLVPTPSPHSVLEQQAAAAAAAAALAAAASVGAYNPQAGLYVMPNIPGSFPLGSPAAPQTAPTSEANPAGGGSSNPDASSAQKDQQQASGQPQQHQQQHEPHTGASSQSVCPPSTGAEALAREAPVQGSRTQEQVSSQADEQQQQKQPGNSEQPSTSSSMGS